jgi:hypothetical protein
MVNNQQNHDDQPLEPSGIAQFVEHDRCPRYLKQRIEPGEEADTRDWREAFGLMNIALLAKGQEFEADQLKRFAADASKVIASELEDQPKTGVPDIPVDETWVDSPMGRTTQLTAAINHAATLTAINDEILYILLYQVPLSGVLGEEWGADPNARTFALQAPDGHTTETDDPLSVGVVTAHNAQRTALETVLPASITANTVEKCQGGERDIIAVSTTVSDPRFVRSEDRFILNLRQLFVAISRSKLLTIVVCSTALFEVPPKDSNRLNDGPVWARLFTQTVGRDPDPAWAGPLGESAGNEHADVPVRVHPSSIHTDWGDG